jgi:1,3-beta-glucan synthase
MMLVFFEVMFVLEGFNFSRTLLGMIAAISIQRFVLKLIISLALTREFKTDSANIAWWTGKWYNMGWHSLSQPGREFLCKITELSMFAGDFILGHFILFLMLPVLVIPYVDKFHSVMLFWLRPSKQIRPPIYSLKQSKLRKRRVIRYAILYFLLFVVFMALIIGPVIAGKMPALKGIGKSLGNPMDLFQPASQNNNDTTGEKTGKGLEPGQGATNIGTGSEASATDESEAFR